MQSGVLVQAMPEPPPVVVPAAEPPVAVPAVGAEPPAALPPAEVPALGGAGVSVPAPSLVDEQARGKPAKAQNGMRNRETRAIPHLMSGISKDDRLVCHPE
jgi:hypothetical protein